jgi:superfamily II DNA or RNA helicase
MVFDSLKLIIFVYFTNRQNLIMSAIILSQNITKQQAEKYNAELTVISKANDFSPTPYKIIVAESSKGKVYVPLAYYKTRIEPVFGEQKDDIKTDEIKSFEFRGNLTEIQSKDKDYVIEKIQKERVAILSYYCGFGKSILSVYLASIFKLKTAVICHRLNIMDQWYNTFLRLSPKTSIRIITPNINLDSIKDYDVIILNVSNVRKFPREAFEHIKFLIVDEAHTICSEVFSKSLLYFTPKYAVALSATPERTDNLDKVLYLHFGNEIIYRPLFKSFNYFIQDTDFFPPIKLNSSRKLDWNNVLNCQSSNVERNDIILRIIKFFCNRSFLVLCKRVENASILYASLKESNENVDLYVRCDRYFNSSARILISTYSKSGVGFDNPNLDALLIAGDVESLFLQYLGRVFRKEMCSPIVFDFRDRFKPLQNHLRTREVVYKEHGGVANDFNINDY